MEQLLTAPVENCQPVGLPNIIWGIAGIRPFEGLSMTQLLEQAIGEARKLSESQQDSIAALILEELADERRWDEAFAGSQDQLSRLAAKVRRDIADGRVRDVGIDEL
jgi:hypothetical protein